MKEFFISQWFLCIWANIRFLRLCYIDTAASLLMLNVCSLKLLSFACVGEEKKNIFLHSVSLTCIKKTLCVSVSSLFFLHFNVETIIKKKLKKKKKNSKAKIFRSLMTTEIWQVYFWNVSHCVRIQAFDYCCSYHTIVTFHDVDDGLNVSIVYQFYVNDKMNLNFSRASSKKSHSRRFAAVFFSVSVYRIYDNFTCDKHTTTYLFFHPQTFLTKSINTKNTTITK